MQRYLVPIFTPIAIFTLTACGPSPDEDVEYDAGNTYETDDYDSYEPRRGTLKLEVLIEQTLDKTEDTGDKKHQFLSNYILEAKLTQDVYVVEDFTYFHAPDGKPNTEARLDYFESSPYWGIDDVDPKITGTITYDGQFKTEHPNALDYVIMDIKNNGAAKLEWLKLKNLEPSIYGNGLQFDLEWLFKGTENTSKYFLSQSGHVTKDTDTHDEKKHRNEDYEFYPLLNKARLDAYPYAYEYRDIPQYLEDNRNGDILIANSFEEQSNQNYDITNFFGAITEATEDRLTVTYEGTGRLLNLNYLHTLPIKPNVKSQISVKIAIEAD